MDASIAVSRIISAQWSVQPENWIICHILCFVGGVVTLIARAPARDSRKWQWWCLGVTGSLTSPSPLCTSHPRFTRLLLLLCVPRAHTESVCAAVKSAKEEKQLISFDPRARTFCCPARRRMSPLHYYVGWKFFHTNYRRRLIWIGGEKSWLWKEKFWKL